MKDNRRNIPIKSVIIIVFMIAMSASIGSIGYLVFSGWLSSAKQTTESIAGEINEHIYNQIYSFLHIPEQINESNHKIIANEILDLSDEEQRDKFFVGVLDSYEDEIYSFSYGTASGEYYGARRNENNIIEIMKNNAATGGCSWYYSVNKDLTAGELTVKAGKFNPCTRAWYKAAAGAGVPTFSPVYKHFLIDDLAISYACPIYNNDGTLNGVLGTHMLLKDIGTYLADTISKYNGYAVILEKNSNKLIANSMGVNNFAVQDGDLERYGIGEIQNSDIQDAYAQYKTKLEPNFFYEGKDQNLYINAKEIHMAGLDWVVISAIPESYLITPAVQSIRLAAILAALFLLLSFIIYIVIAGRLLKPMNSLLQATEAFSSGDLTRRIEIVRNDEIGKISESFNNLSDKIQFLINNLEATVKKRTEELQKANMTLDENKNQLQLILDSAAEAIYGIDVHGNCTFCNISCTGMLGYGSQSELLGKNMHWQIHHSRRDGTPLPAEDCRILKSFIRGQGAHVDDEVFWRADGTSIDVEYYSYPQIKKGEIIGTVVTFWDISDRKHKEAEIKYLNCHDILTGLYNRRCFEENRAKIDTPDNLPLSVIFADANGLKMTNDIFGHSAGDELIKKSSEILKQVCRPDDIIARVGGDEFIMLLPKTTGEAAGKILAKIKSGFADARVESIKCSISLGFDTKTSPDQPLDEILSNAENAMYKDKTLNRTSTNKNIFNTIIETLHSRNPMEKKHAITVSELGVGIGNVLHLPETEISKLKRAGYLHDIGKIAHNSKDWSKDMMLDDELENMRQHAVVGYRILNLFDDTLDLAEYVYGHHERWDGTGYPRELKGEQIPLISRIIAVAETYDRVLNRGGLSPEERKAAALDVIKKGAGTHFDPRIAEIFVKMLEKKEKL